MCIRHYGNLYKVLNKQASSKVFPEIQFEFVNSPQTDKSQKDVATYAQQEMHKN